MEGVARFLVQQPAHILGVAIALLLLWLAIRPRKRSMLMASLGWLAYAAWEWLVQVQSPEANIRVDLLLLWPLLAFLTSVALLKLLFSRFARSQTHE